MTAAHQGQVHRCSAGRECRQASQTEDPDGRIVRQGAEIAEPYGLCDACTKAVSHAVGDMTETWLALHAAIGDQTRRAGQKVSGSRAAPININVDVDSLKGQITDWLTTAAARLSEQLNIDDPQPVNNTDFEHARVVLACTRILAPNVDRLLGLPAEEVNVWLGHGETERPGELWFDKWGVSHGRTAVPMSGVDLALKLAELRNKARKLLGLNNPGDKLSHPCPYCNQMSLKRHHILAYSSGSRTLDEEETDRAQCHGCGLDWPYKRYENLCLIWLKEDEMERDKLQKQLDEAQREKDILAWLLARREHQFALALDCDAIPASVWAKECLLVDIAPPEPELMNDRDIAAIVAVSDGTVRSWASQGHIQRHTQDDGSVLFDAREVWEHAITTSGKTAVRRNLDNQRKAHA